MKKFVVYQVNPDFAYSLINQAAMATTPYVPCSDADISKIGFLPFYEGDLDESGNEVDTYVKQDDGFIYLQVKEQKKLVPTKKKLVPLVEKALRQYVEREPEVNSVEDIEKETKQAIEDKVFQDQLKNCFHNDTTTLVIVDKKSNLVYIESGSYKAAELITACIRSVTDTFPLIQLCDAVQSSSIGDHFMNMVKNQYAEVITLGEYCKLEDGEKASHTVSKKDLYDAEDELSVIFKKQYTCKEIHLEHDGVYDYKVKSTLEFSSVRLDAKDKEASESANLMLVGAAVQELVAELVKELGGLE